ncbi:MAG: ABC transporter ATP-binding protein [Myxococcales bacterium]|nr:ABC transporter ATP-binding protein [Myxococcales bacterium]
MSAIAIKASGLGKRHRLGGRSRYLTLREALVSLARAPFARASKRDSKGFLWALRNASFEISHGQAVGVVGRNGAGKSTLLKLLARITEPSEGSALVHGRVRSLLEVGTGFHPELTGRENVFLNGAILGMKRAEIARKFDEIVSFAGVELHLDTPVKHYSSGMYVRLAFAVAAHLEPEILLIDEVLAVGDAAFQRKCLGRMDEVARGGRTVLFVSHHLNAVRRLCGHCLWLDGGELKRFGPTGEVVSAYEASLLADPRAAGPEERHARFTGWSLGDSGSVHVLDTLGTATVHFEFETPQPIERGRHGITLRDHANQIVWGWAVSGLKFPRGRNRLTYRFSSLPLRPGAYQWQVTLFEEDRMLDEWYGAPAMTIDTEVLADCRDEFAGLLNLPFEFVPGPKED